jgi:hypothetical protein
MVGWELRARQGCACFFGAVGGGRHDATVIEAAAVAFLLHSVANSCQQPTESTAVAVQHPTANDRDREAGCTQVGELLLQLRIACLSVRIVQLPTQWAESVKGTFSQHHFCSHGAFNSQLSSPPLAASGALATSQHINAKQQIQLRRESPARC